MILTRPELSLLPLRPLQSKQLLQQLLLKVLLLSWWLSLVSATFVDSQPCSSRNLKLKPFITDAALDEENKLLKFFINTQVLSIHPEDNKNRDIIISDVNLTTNRYTTFHIDIDFMGKNFISENKRFCDMVSVKNTTAYQNSPRFASKTIPLDGEDGTDGTDGDEEAEITLVVSSLEEIHESEPTGKDFAGSNSTIQSLFSNSTGTLVSCPLYYNDSIMLYYEADVSEHFHRLGSYQVKFSVISNDNESSTIGCGNSYVTPFQPDAISDLVILGVLTLMSAAAAINIFIVSYSSYQESSNPFLFKASTFCNKKLLEQVDASVIGLIMYLQYVSFLGGLGLAYPGFLQPMIGLVKWCMLLGITAVSHSKEMEIYKEDNVYVTLSSGGLSTLALYGGGLELIDLWPNFMIVLCALCCLIVVARQLFIFVKKVFDRMLRKWLPNQRLIHGNSSTFAFFSKKNLYLILGHVLQLWFYTFGMPFLVITSFMFLAANDINGRHRNFASYWELSKCAFSFTTPYEELMIPLTVFTFGVSSDPSSSSFSSRASSSTLSTVEGASADSMHIITKNDDYSSHNYTSSPFYNSTLEQQYQNERGEKYMSVSTTCLVFGGILFACWIGLLIWFIFHYLIRITKKFRIKSSKNVSKLYTNLKTILIWSLLYYEYKPQRVYFVIFDLCLLFTQLMIIGLLQKLGIVQVFFLLALSMLELFMRYFFKPYYVKVKPWSTKFIFPVAKFLCTALSMAYIRTWQVSETVKTYVAYIQLLIHAFVAIVFIIQLLYLFAKTLVSMFKVKKWKTIDSTQVSMMNGVDEFDRAFEYRPVVPAYKPMDAALMKHETESTNFNDANADAAAAAADDDDDNNYDGYLDDNFYFRGTNIYAKDNDTRSDLESNYSFLQQQKESDSRKLRNDYKVREADQIYHKYFTDDQIDPEIKELWDSRKFYNDSPAPVEELEMKPFTMRMRNRLYGRNNVKCEGTQWKNKYKNKKEVTKKNNDTMTADITTATGFQVSRPKKLVVKTLEEVQVQHGIGRLKDMQGLHDSQDTRRGSNSSSMMMMSEESLLKESF